MVIYEVNLIIDNTIFEEYVNWLKPHISEMLSFAGFSRAYFLEDTEHLPTQKKLVIYYDIEEMKYLEDYLENHAAAMRDDGIKRFGNKFSATRRILNLKQAF